MERTAIIEPRSRRDIEGMEGMEQARTDIETMDAMELTTPGRDMECMATMEGVLNFAVPPCRAPETAVRGAVCPQ